jgi:transposase
MAKYAPELNDVEHDWKTPKAHHLAHKTFKNRDDLKIAIVAAIQAINSTRNHNRWPISESLLSRNSQQVAPKPH